MRCSQKSRPGKFSDTPGLDLVRLRARWATAEWARLYSSLQNGRLLPAANHAASRADQPDLGCAGSNPSSQQPRAVRRRCVPRGLLGAGVAMFGIMRKWQAKAIATALAAAGSDVVLASRSADRCQQAAAALSAQTARRV